MDAAVYRARDLRQAAGVFQGLAVSVGWVAVVVREDAGEGLASLMG
jgi:phage shock protein PspC (stress-responsive transcriptional regulator)